MFDRGQLFGITNGVITMLALITGLYATRVPKVGIIGAILSLLIADPLCDAYSMYIAEKGVGNKEAFITGRNAFLYQFILQFLFLSIVIISPKISQGVFWSYIFGLIITIVYGVYTSTSAVDIIKHLLGIFTLVCITYLSDTFVYKFFKKK